MKRMLLASSVGALMITSVAGPATAAPTKATNYEALDAVCEEMGDVVIEVVGAGMWSTGKIQGTNITLIPQHFQFSGTDLDTNTVVFEDFVEKRNPSVDDVCVISSVEEVPADNPEGVPAGTYLFEATVGAKVVGR